VACLGIENVLMEDNTMLDILANSFSAFFCTLSSKHDSNLNCFFQYIKTFPFNASGGHFPLTQLYKKYSIIVENNVGVAMFSNARATSHCNWIDDSVYKYADPHEINQHIIKYENNSFDSFQNVQNICYCTDDQHYNCTLDELGPVYPGQTYTLSFDCQHYS